MITNADMTLYNYWRNPETGESEYRRTQISGVHWYTSQKATVTEKGGVSANTYKIRIPRDAIIQEQRIFIDAKQYHLLGNDEVDRYWTVDTEDIFAKGLVDFSATSLSSLKQFSESGKIFAYSVNDFGLNPHIRIEGVA